MGFLIKVAGYRAVKDFLLPGIKAGARKGTANRAAAFAELQKDLNHAQKHNTGFNGTPIAKLKEYQLQGVLEELAENGMLNAANAADFGFTGPLKPAKGWSDETARYFIEGARESLSEKAKNALDALELNRQVGAADMGHLREALYVKALDSIAALRASNKEAMTMRDAALAKFLAERPRLLMDNGVLAIDQKLAEGMREFDKYLPTAIRRGLDNYRKSMRAAGANAPVPQGKKPDGAPDVPPGEKPGTQPDTDITVRPATASDALPNTEPNAQVFKDKKAPGKLVDDATEVIDLTAGKKTPKTKPGWLRWRNLGIGASGLAGAGALTYGINRAGEVSADEEANSRNARVPLSSQEALDYYKRLRGDSSLQSQLHNVGMTSPSSLQRNFGNQFNYLFGAAPGVPFSPQPGLPPIRLQQ